MESSLEGHLLDQLENNPEFHWTHGDDKCNCTFQRIGQWANPYIGKTIQIRLCCAWAKLFERPEMAEFYQEFDGYWNENTQDFDREPIPWNSDSDMPRYLFYRQVATVTGQTLDEVRAEWEGKDLPEETKATLTEEGEDMAPKADPEKKTTDVPLTAEEAGLIKTGLQSLGITAAEEGLRLMLGIYDKLNPLLPKEPQQIPSRAQRRAPKGK